MSRLPDYSRRSEANLPCEEARIQCGRQQRMYWLFIVLCAVALGIFTRLVYMQVVMADEWSALATEQRTRELTTQPRRGTIFDREGEVLATSVNAKTIVCNPRQVRDPEGVARALAAILPGEYDTYLSQLTWDAGFRYIERKISVELADQVAALGLEGVSILDDTIRVYPNGDLAGQVLGHVDVDDVGRSGIESFYNDVLTGTPGELVAERGLKGIAIPGGLRNETPAVDGEDIILTIDKDIQAFAQSQLATAVAEWGAKGGTVVVMNPRNGDVYAMASAESFNPNEYRTADTETIRNQVVTDVFEPGSTLKAITAAAVIDRGVFEESDSFTLPYSIQVYDQTIRDSSPRETVTYTFEQIIAHSSNVGTVKLAEGLGAQTFYDYLVAFGLTQKPPTDLPGVGKGLLADLKNWYGTTLANVSFGQGISTTALQLARAYTALANDGILANPHVVNEIVGQGKTAQGATLRAVSASAATRTTRILVSAASVGTGNKVDVPGYVVAGKTGTAQKARSTGVGYEEGSYVSSFIGYLPADDPQLLVYVVLDEPRNAYYGVTVATPTFNKVATFAAEHLRIPTSRSDQPESQTSESGDVTTP